MSEKERVNMFDKAADDRRKKIIIENESIADEFFATQVRTDTKTKVIDLLNIKDKNKKKGFYYYIEERIDDLFKDMSKVIGTDKSPFINELLLIFISESLALKEMSERNPDIAKLLDEFNK